MPHARTLRVYLLLSSPKVGHFPGMVLLDDAGDQALDLVTFRVSLAEENEPVAITVNLREVEFPEAKQYLVSVCFTSPEGTNVVKGEHPFRVHHHPPE